MSRCHAWPCSIEKLCVVCCQDGNTSSRSRIHDWSQWCNFNDINTANDYHCGWCYQWYCPSVKHRSHARVVTITGSSDLLIDGATATTGKGFLTYTSTAVNALVVLKNLVLTNQEPTTETIRINSAATANIQITDCTILGTQATGTN